ncbi:phosphonate C-P lyase system protein PhnH [Paenibacillus sp. MWE-103]|uniref:Phosphonate C-P lyase system protein PhnH n=1 Tax=Paenibacillus artemisiicola TaxID=1172618 RepID=A0ABS3WC75_9BACL|nr:phosphonate C-P lyase system protein PhnH [Paenibacillus artemisiicola]MBO7745873.1 phosphonate C-P lyase system protein PhnH [Paenibacillus artemisiicola]
MTAQNETLFDPVHDTQLFYRELLDAFAEPGTVKTTRRLTAGAAELAPGSRLAAVIALTLLDSEVRFAVELEDKERLSAFIRMHTFARSAEPAGADYIFADGRTAPPAWADAVGVGTLAEPEHGATVFLLVDDLAEAAESEAAPAAEGIRLTLTGPGVPGERTLAVAGLRAEWLARRAVWNAEYPLGADAVLFTVSGKLAALPRTTRAASKSDQGG